MLEPRNSILIVDDSVTLRTTLSMVFAESGYKVHVAANGFSALAQMKTHEPALLLSDLNMPGMSGFELLSIVRRRFPNIRVIAMSGAFGGDEVPRNIAADAFYPKGKTSIVPLLARARQLIEQNPPPSRPASVPIWIPRTRLLPCNDEHLFISCQECLRVFPHCLTDIGFSDLETSCLHCSGIVRFALVQEMPDIDLTASSKDNGDRRDRTQLKSSTTLGVADR